jgi:hypothetical protein
LRMAPEPGRWRVWLEGDDRPLELKTVELLNIRKLEKAAFRQHQLVLDGGSYKVWQDLVLGFIFASDRS